MTLVLTINGILFSAQTIEADFKKTRAGDQDQVVTVLKNQLGNVSFKCDESIPKNLDDLVHAIVTAKREKQNIKAIGGFYAFSLVNPTLHCN